MPARPRISNYSRAQYNSDEQVAERQSQFEARRSNTSTESTYLSDLRELESHLRIEENRLESACTQHPDLLYRVVSEVALQRSRRDAKKKQVEEKEAALYVDMRHNANVAGERTTENEIKANITLNRGYSRLTDELLAENEKLSRWEALREAFSQRSYMLRELVSLYLARYYGGDPASQAEHRMRDVATEGMRQARRERNQQRENNHGHR